MNQVYPIPSAPHQHELEIKRSQFLTFIGTASGRDEAEAFIRRIRELHPQARHVCWAYIAGAPGTTVMSMSDDGEPGGTAGRPMLNALVHSGIGEIVVAVVRYFGGIKLGTGGLQRAYSDSVTLALADLPLKQRVPVQRLRLEFSYALEANVRHHLGSYGAAFADPDYGQQVVIEAEVADEKCAQFCDELTNLCAGAVSIQFPEA